ncbi:serine/threonine protein phosphatase [Geminocystis sp. NIES-3708]|uniref:metallophosphoesterase family protein n=1 Tax=Geminocystis sp. NIES-3708 TaxID=1615909 RepID=UPI0005FC9CF3|nr:metallophosphoesterase family protein [Geminocystis sp. NIES-3708]BAQ61028.1 serine/threonine protein phosphatase [Geminocystis sp. NIES-3708]
MSNKRLVIGDVHGHYDALLRLFENIAPDKEDQIYFLGDLIDRGPHSAQVVEFVMNNDYNCIQGNHEIMLLNALNQGQTNYKILQGWLQNGGSTTVNSYGQKMPPIEHIEWIKNLPLYYDLGDYWLVHAGIDPNLRLEQQSSDQFCWIRTPFHVSTHPYFLDKTIIIGHTITFTFKGLKPGQLARGQGWIGIDTGVYHHEQGWLTALELNESMVYQVNSFGKNFRKFPLNQCLIPINNRKLFSFRPKALFS